MTDEIAALREIAQDVYQTLGSGHPEVIYDRAMQVGLRLAGLHYESQKVLELTYKNYYVGEAYPDLVVHFDGKSVVVELKAVGSKLGVSEEQQLRNYLNVLGIEQGVLINFQAPGRRQGETRLEFREITRR